MTDLSDKLIKVYDSAGARHSRLSKRAAAAYEYFDRAGLYLVTLTYRPGSEPSKTDITASRKAYLRAFSSAHPDSPLPRILWVRELTKAGRLHYHLIISSDHHPGFWDKSAIWPHGLTRCDTVNHDGRNIVAGYLLKYATKVESKIDAVWRSWRSYGFSGFSLPEKSAISYALLPRWARQSFTVDDFLSVSKRTLLAGRRLCSGWKAFKRRRADDGSILKDGQICLVFDGVCPISYGRLMFRRLHPGL